MEELENKNKEDLKKLLKEYSLKFGDFVLASGKKSKYYFDSKLTTLLGMGAYLTGYCLMDMIEENHIEAEGIGGMTLGADPIVTAVAIESYRRGKELNAFIVRKEEKGHGTKKWIEGVAEEGERVIIVDDIVTTGASTMKAVIRAEEIGLRVVAIVALVDREEGGREALSAYPFFPLFKKNDLMD